MRPGERLSKTPKSKPSPKTLIRGSIEPTTQPSRTQEPPSQPSNTTPPISNHLARVPVPLGSGTNSRRSLRLASKLGCSEEIMKNVSISSPEIKGGCSIGSEFNLGSVEREVVGNFVNSVENEGLVLGMGKGRVSTRNARESMVLGEKMGVGESGGGVERVESGGNDKGKRKFDVDDDLSGLEVKGEGGKEYLKLRSGMKVAKMGLDGIDGSGSGCSGGFGGGHTGDGDKMVHESESGGNDKESKRVLDGGSGEGVWRNGSDRVSGVGENVSVRGSRRFRTEEKGKEKSVDQGLIVNDVDPVELEIPIGNEVSDAAHVPESLDSEKYLMPDENGTRSKASRMFSREEKGKGKLVGVEIVSRKAVEMVLGSKVENTGSDIAPLVDKATVEDIKQVVETPYRLNNSRRYYKDRFRDIARRNASRFAHFSSQEEVEISVDNEAATEARQIEVDEEVEDWPGPFSTAMKIIKDQGMNVNAQQQRNSSLGKSRSAPVAWVPKTSHSKRLVPSLQELCMGILARNADAITSLDSVPDVLRHKLTQLLCDSRRMNSHFLNLLVSGSPIEIRVRDCSWLTEEQFMKIFEVCDTNNLAVLQLDQCGRCMPDYILCSTLDHISNRFPVLTTISLKGACRLSDIGLSALVSSAPSLRSVNLSQCSLLTSDGMNSLANSLGSVLRELYIDDCQSINAMLILPALSKLEHLEVLSLAGIQTVCDDFIIEFVVQCGHNMKELVLTDCVKLTDSSLKIIAKYCPGLRAIDLANLCKLTDSAIGYLANGCRAVQTLRLCRNAFSDEAVAAYVETCGDSLKELSLNNVNKVADNTAISLARHSRNLLSLDLSWCRFLTNEAIGLIVDSCLTLKMLKLFGCTQITNVFLDGHSNPQVQIIGVKLTRILEHMKVPDPLDGPLHYSSVSSSM